MMARVYAENEVEIRRQERRRNKAQFVQLLRSISTARSRINHMTPKEISASDRKVAVSQLNLASTILRQSNSQFTATITTRILLPYNTDTVSAVDAFVGKKKFSTLRAIAEANFEEVETDMKKLGLEIPIALSAMMEAYQELSAEKMPKELKA